MIDLPIDVGEVLYRERIGHDIPDHCRVGGDLFGKLENFSFSCWVMIQSSFPETGLRPTPAVRIVSLYSTASNATLLVPEKISRVYSPCSPKLESRLPSTLKRITPRSKPVPIPAHPAATMSPSG